MADLGISGVSLSFGGLEVLRDVSFEARAGELLALIGPNGAGKTSILNCISGLYRPTAGTIRFGGVDLARRAPHAIARSGVARTFQHGELFHHMSVVENLLVARHSILGTNLMAEALHLPAVRAAETEHRRRVEEILELVELERHRHAAVDSLPFGLQKLVGFARALALEPKALLLDEPSAGLNREEREDLARYILRIRHRLGIVMIWVEHDMQMVADLADRVCVLNHGRVLADGPTDSVLKAPHVIAAYVG
jgi:branched-chain amino acid transport system ATP-binding protein